MSPTAAETALAARFPLHLATRSAEDVEAFARGRERDAHAILARHLGPLYQTHTHLGVELNVGVRGVERRRLVDLADVRGRRVLDLGCATGAECFWAVEEGAERALGIDRDGPNYFTFYELITRLEPARVWGLWWDLARGLDLPLVAFLRPQTVFAFAVSHHLGYRPLWEEVPTATVAYVEGGGNSPYTADALSRNGWRATLLGRTPGNRLSFEPARPLFRLERR